MIEMIYHYQLESANGTTMPLFGIAGRYRDAGAVDRRRSCSSPSGAALMRYASRWFRQRVGQRAGRDPGSRRSLA